MADHERIGSGVVVAGSALTAANPEATRFLHALVASGDRWIGRVNAIEALAAIAEIPDVTKDLAQERIQTALDGVPRDQLIEMRSFLEQTIDGLNNLDTLAQGVPAHISISLKQIFAYPKLRDAFVMLTRSSVFVPGHLPRPTLLRRSILTLLISDFELLVASCFSLILAYKPEILGADTTIAMADLRGLGSIAAAEQYIIDRRVDNLMRDGLTEWVEWFDHLGVKWSDMTDDWSTMVEAMARRNLIVHADGVVNADYFRYLEKCGAAVPVVPMGAVVDVDEEYLKGVIERYLAFGCLLVAGTLLQLLRGDDKAQSAALAWLADRCQLLGEEDNCAAASIIAHTVLQKSRGRANRELELQFKVLDLACRACNGDPTVVDDAMEWDVTGLDRRYVHAKDVFTRNDAVVIETIKQALRVGKLTEAQLRRRPLYHALLTRIPIETIIDSDVPDPRESVEAHESKAPE